MALFITFEGGDGSGKSTQARALYRKIQRAGLPGILTHEPGGTPLGERICRWLKWAEDISPLTELLLFNASRAELVNRVIRPALEQGKIVICDRFADSTVAYQGYGRGIGRQIVSAANHIATQGLKPDLTVFLDVSVELGLGRKASAGEDRFQAEDIAFHCRVRDGYLKLAAAEPGRWVVVDGTQRKNRTAAIIWGRVSEFIQREQDAKNL